MGNVFYCFLTLTSQKIMRCRVNAMVNTKILDLETTCGLEIDHDGERGPGEVRGIGNHR